MAWYAGKIAETERNPHGPWARIRLDTGTTLYIRERRLDELGEQFGSFLPETVLRFRANPLLKRVQAIELVTTADGWGLPMPFTPHPARKHHGQSPTLAHFYMSLVERIRPGPPKNGMEVSLQRARRHALGVGIPTVHNRSRR